MTDDAMTPAPKPSQVRPYAAPLRQVAVGTLRIISMGIAAFADSIEDKKD